MGNKRRWFIFYTRSRAEKRVELELLEDGFEVFLPKIKEMRIWSDRKKQVEVPLFRSYIFINIEEKDIVPVIQWYPNLVAHVKFAGKPAILRKEEKELVEQMLETGWALATSQISSISPGDPIEIEQGPLKGYKGEYLSDQGQDYFQVRLEAIGQVVKAKVPKGIVKKI